MTKTSKHTRGITLIVSIGLSLVLVYCISQIVIVAFFSNKSVPADKDINSYEKCVAAGNLVQETFPTRCVTPGGKAFVGPSE